MERLVQQYAERCRGFLYTGKMSAHPLLPEIVYKQLECGIATHSQNELTGYLLKFFEPISSTGRLTFLNGFM